MENDTEPMLESTSTIDRSEIDGVDEQCSQELSQLTQLVKGNGGHQTYIDCSLVNPCEYYLADFQPLNKREYWIRQDRTNQGWQGKWVDPAKNTFEDNDTVIRGVADAIGLTQRERRRAVGTFHALDLQVTGFNKLHTAFALCAWVIHTDDADKRRYSPRIKPENRDTNIDQTRESMNISTRQYRNAHKKLMKSLPHDSACILTDQDYYRFRENEFTDHGPGQEAVWN